MFAREWMLLSFSAVFFCSACSHVGYRDTSGRSMEHLQACRKDCLEQQKVCQVTDPHCQSDFEKCSAECERFSGVRSGSGSVSISLP